MKGNWRPLVAASLSWVLLLLSFTAELAHQHGSWSAGTPNVTTAAPADDAQLKQAHSYTCVACLYSFTQVAVAFSFQHAGVLPDAFCLAATKPSFHSFCVVIFADLRAPPTFSA